MRIVTLSDHASEQIKKSQDVRSAVNDRLLADWQAAVDLRAAKITEHGTALRQAWAERRVVAAIGSFVRLLRARLKRKPIVPPLLAAGADEGRYKGGQQGEARVVASLSRLFDDNWIAFKGYANRGGETDLLLVGPTTIAAVEVKYRNATVHCDGNAWTCDKRDRFGTVIEQGIPMRDAKGRSPGQQVNATADGLQAQLARRGYPLPVRRAVVLAHDGSRVGRVHQPGVDFIGVLADRGFHSQFLALVQPPPGRPDLDVAALEQVVIQDHRYHALARAQRPGMTHAPTPAPEQLSSPASAGPALEPSEPTGKAMLGPRPVRHLPPTFRAEREVWMHGEDQALPAFRAMLAEAISARVPLGPAVQAVELDLHGYLEQEKAVGMSWLGQTPSRPVEVADRTARRVQRRT